MIGFLVATYNEENEIIDLLNSVEDLAEFFVISDDGSTDNTVQLAEMWGRENDKDLTVLRNPHKGLPETVKKIGTEYIRDNYGQETWVLMLDADERIPQQVQDLIFMFHNSKYSDDFTHAWFNMAEFIDGKQTRGFLKCRFFRAGFAKFSESVHEDDRFEGQGVNFNWTVVHRKTEAKQRQREREYLETYKKLLAEGKVTQEWVDRCIGFHYFVKE